jgi:hypothetical protein
VAGSRDQYNQLQWTEDKKEGSRSSLVHAAFLTARVVKTAVVFSETTLWRLLVEI